MHQKWLCLAINSGGGYKSPEIKTVLFQPEGVLCLSVIGFSHEDFVIDEVIDEL